MPSHDNRGCAARSARDCARAASTNAAGRSASARSSARRSARRRRPARRSWSRAAVDAEDAGPLDVQVQEPRPAAARRAADRAFGDPALVDQLIDDRRHGAALQTRLAARSARDIGWCRRMKFSAMRRLICRAVSLVASWKLVRSILRMLWGEA